METYPNLVGNQENWASFITNVEMLETPFLDWLRVGDKPVNVLYDYQADAYASPRINSHVDGQPWTAFRSAGDQRGRLKALIQWLDNTSAVSLLVEDVSNPAGVDSELARDIPKRMKEMGRDAECNFLEDHDGREDNQVQGYLSRAAGSWISSSAQTLHPVPTAFLTPSGSIKSTATGSVVENDFRDIFQNMKNQTKDRETISGFVGPGLKRKFSDFQFFIPSSVSTQASGVTFNQQSKDRSIVRGIDRYHSDFAPVDLILSWYNASITGSSTVSSYRGYFLHHSKWMVRWHTKPRVYRLPFEGGSYEAGMLMILMLLCLNPKGEGKYAPTS